VTAAKQPAETEVQRPADEYSTGAGLAVSEKKTTKKSAAKRSRTATRSGKVRDED
jgi:hypothetical protein